jgi:cyclophilin family peptidyl-prolyl cis-trans isomerase
VHEKELDYTTEKIIDESDRVLEKIKESRQSSSNSIITDGKNNKETMAKNIATFTTNKGSFEIELSAEQTPQTVENFTTLAKKGFYDETKFHRIIEGFMIQGGDPNSKDDSLKSRWGTGGPGYAFEDEFVAELSNVSGTISMANSGPNTNGSQFFINVADNVFLNGKHTVFGKIVSGMDVIEALSRVATDPSDKPLDPVIITSITIQ